MTNQLTVYNQVHAGEIMNECRLKIQELLDESGICILHKISLLDLMVFEMKHSAIKVK